MLLAIALFCATPAIAQDRSLDDIEREREMAVAEEARLATERRAVEAQLDELKQDMTRIGSEADALEAQEAELVARVDRLDGEATFLEGRIGEDRVSLARLIGTLQRIEANPPPAIASGGTSAIDSARAARVTAGVSRALKARTDKLTSDLAELRDVRIQLDGERVNLADKREALNARRAELRRLSKEKADLSTRLGSEQAAQAARAAKLAAEADTLRELIASLERAADVEPRVKPRRPRRDGGVAVPRLKPPVGGPAVARPLPDGLRFADARGQLGLPVRGRVASGYSRESKGVSVATSSGAQVVSPYGGRVEFAGDFKNYERLVILNAGDGYFVVLAGMGETFVASGEVVGTGEPVGAMPRGGEGELYIEFRKDGRTIDPSPWLTTASG